MLSLSKHEKQRPTSQDRIPLQEKTTGARLAASLIKG
jgi:hypothetical protein